MVFGYLDEKSLGKKMNEKFLENDFKIVVKIKKTISTFS